MHRARGRRRRRCGKGGRRWMRGCCGGGGGNLSGLILFQLKRNAARN